MNSHESRPKTIFLDALEITDSAERSAFLDAQCAGDDALRSEVEALLLHHQLMGGFLNTGPVMPAATIDSLELTAGRATVGPYKLQWESDEAIATFRKAVELKPDLVIFTDLGMALAARGKLDDVIVVFRKGIELKPSADNYNAAAWTLAVSPLSQQRHLAIAAEWAARAVELSPKDGNFWNTLGIARYRVSQGQPAIDALGKAMELRGGGDASDWFFLAMAHWQLGHKVEARKWYDKAVEWMEKKQPMNEELIRFRAEAVELLGISEQQNSKPSNSQPENPKP
jgi:tetratricopeptide (TPR) repeat protein